MKKIVAGLAILQLVGCASIKYPGWETVAVEQSVFKKPCVYVASEKCLGSDGCTDWLKKHATRFKANTLVIEKDSLQGLMFICKAGNPLFYDYPGAIWLVKNKFNPQASKLDLEKTMAECTYQSHSATVDQSTPMQARAYVPTANLSYALNQQSAQIQDSINARRHSNYLADTQATLFDECLKAKGFMQTRGEDEQSYNLREKYCKGINNYAEPCLLPATE